MTPLPARLQRDIHRFVVERQKLDRRKNLRRFYIKTVGAIIGALAAIYLFSGCAQTRIYEDGKLVAVIDADCINVDLRTYKGGTFHADSLNHSAPIKAYGGEVASIVGTAAAATVTIFK